MSLIGSGPETVVVYPEESFEDSYGDIRRRPAEVGVTVSGCIVQPMSELRVFPSNDATQQQRVYSTWRLIARDAPLGIWSKVVWRGKSLSVRSGPEFRNYSSRTSHVTALLQEDR